MGTQINSHFISSIVAVTGSDIDWSAGYMFEKTLNEHTTFTFSNPSTGQWITVRVAETGGGFTGV